MSTSSPPPITTTTPTSDRQARIKIVQQPLHARMCGFGEKDRRPVDPPPIVQLLLDEQHDQHPARRAHRSAIAAALAVASSTGKKGSSAKKKSAGAGAGAGKQVKGGKKAGAGGQEEDADEESAQGDHEDDDGDETYQHEEGSDADEAGGDKKTSSARNGRSSKGGAAKNLKHEHGTGSASSPSLGKHGRQSTKSDHSNSDSDNNSDSENDNNDIGDNGDLDEQDPLFVLHVSLWSHDGTEVRNMIATPGQSDPPKLTRILMGSLVVSPILLNNPEGVPGWYFSFPDLSIRTEGTYTLKFSLMRFGSCDFSSSEDGQASLLVAEEISDPFQVFSAKKFPGMTESTELSKAFAKQGLKIPIRNDLRVRKADRE
ncbi:velvet factor [Linnemannia elongata]|nr:velvet factor [Linnemannia elongata]